MKSTAALAFNQRGTGKSTRSDVYARRDIYDMEYEGAEIAQQYGDYRFVRVDRTSPYVVTVARRRADRSGTSVVRARPSILQRTVPLRSERQICLDRCSVVVRRRKNR
jgi:hypothetical protein